MNFLKGYKNTGILCDGSIIEFLPDGKAIAYFSKDWKVCGGGIHQFKSKDQAIAVFEGVEKLIIEQKDISRKIALD